jgi:hypothetical protein
METTAINTPARIPWNKGKFTGQKPPLKLKEIWAIRIRLQLSARTRDLAIFNLAIDSKLRACDLTKLRVRDICHGQHVISRATVMQQKTQRPVQFELTEQTRDSAEAWIRTAGLSQSDFLFPSRIHGLPHLSTRQYARLVHRVDWSRRHGVRNPCDASDKGIADLPAHKEPEGGPVGDRQLRYPVALSVCRWRSSTLFQVRRNQRGGPDPLIANQCATIIGSPDGETRQPSTGASP